MEKESVIDIIFYINSDKLEKVNAENNSRPVNCLSIVFISNSMENLKWVLATGRTRLIRTRLIRSST